MNKKYYSQFQIDRMIENLIRQINKKYTKIVGIRNGGIHVSLRMAEALNLPHESFRISFYEGKFTENYEGFNWCPNCLVCDDLIDGGHTLKHFFSKFGLVDTAVLLWAEHNKAGIRPTYYAEKKSPEWAVFPWEL